MDVWNKFLKGVLDHHRGIVIGLVLAIALSIAVVGCSPKTKSLLSEDQQVTLAELEREAVIVQKNLDSHATTITKLIEDHNTNVAAYNKAIELAEEDIARKIAIRQQILEVVGGLGTTIATGGLTAPAAIGSVLQLLTLGFAGGAGVDIVRKNRVINTLKKESA